MLFTEDMADVATRHNLERAVALPDAERYLQIFSAPHLHLHVVLADLIEPLMVYTEQASGNHRRSVTARGRDTRQPIRLKIRRFSFSELGQVIVQNLYLLRNPTTPDRSENEISITHTDIKGWPSEKVPSIQSHTMPY